MESICEPHKLQLDPSYWFDWQVLSCCLTSDSESMYLSADSFMPIHACLHSKFRSAMVIVVLHIKLSQLSCKALFYLYERPLKDIGPCGKKQLMFYFQLLFHYKGN